MLSTWLSTTTSNCENIRRVLGSLERLDLEFAALLLPVQKSSPVAKGDIILPVHALRVSMKFPCSAWFSINFKRLSSRFRRKRRMISGYFAAYSMHISRVPSPESSSPMQISNGNVVFCASILSRHCAINRACR